MRAPTRGMCLLLGAVILCAAGCAREESTATATFNQSATLAGELPTNPLAWRVISSVTDPGHGTMSTLYGNDLAVDYARTHSQHDYPAGSVLSLVTWTQREDPRWFGAEIPGEVKSVEFVTVGTEGKEADRYSYEAYAGNPLKKAPAEESGVLQERIAYFVSTRAAVMP
jgi:hypothetical protein